MAELFQQLLHWVNANPGWAGAVVFLMAFAESLAIVGMAVPGVAVLFTVGALIGAGALDFWPMVAWAVAGAILGDGISFWLGRRYQQQLTRLWPFSRHPETLDRGIAFFETGSTWLSLYGREALAGDATVSSEGSGFRGFVLAHNVRTKEEVDALRWRAPRDPEAWADTLDALSFGSPCVQLATQIGGVPSEDPDGLAGSEDCLYLNL
ncbi:MAG: hypothetical protein DSZ01_05310, partial [Gammaproteobacteria bacterium]